MCLDAFQLEQVAVALKALETCQKEVVLRERLVAEQRTLVAPELSWWQTPSVVVGGIALSVGVTAVLTLALTRR